MHFLERDFSFHRQLKCYANQYLRNNAYKFIQPTLKNELSTTALLIIMTITVFVNINSNYALQVT